MKFQIINEISWYALARRLLVAWYDPAKSCGTWRGKHPFPLSLSIHRPSELPMKWQRLGNGWLVHQSYFCNHCNFRLIYLGLIVLLFVTIYISTKVPCNWAQWCLKSRASRLFTQPFVRAQIKGNIKAMRHWLLWGEFTGDRLTPCTKG